MDQEFAMVIGMTIAYGVSFLGLIVAWIAYRKRGGKSNPEKNNNGGN